MKVKPRAEAAEPVRNFRRFWEDEDFIIPLILKRMEERGNDEIDEIRGPFLMQYFESLVAEFFEDGIELGLGVAYGGVVGGGARPEQQGESEDQPNKV